MLKFLKLFWLLFFISFSSAAIITEFLRSYPFSLNKNTFINLLLVYCIAKLFTYYFCKKVTNSKSIYCFFDINWPLFFTISMAYFHLNYFVSFFVFLYIFDKQIISNYLIFYFFLGIKEGILIFFMTNGIKINKSELKQELFFWLYYFTIFIAGFYHFYIKYKIKIY